MGHVAVGAPPRKDLIAYYIQPESRQKASPLAAARGPRGGPPSRRIATRSPRSGAARRPNTTDCLQNSIVVTFFSK